LEQYDAITKLTQPNLVDDDPANIVGLDWNGPHKVAYKGEYWTPNGWQPADHLSIRETVEQSLKEIKAFWESKDLWPTEEPRDIYGPAVKQPDYPIYANSGEAMRTHEDFETAVIGEYEEGTYAFKSESAKKWVEHRDVLTPLD
jgi:hypothetical protein